MSVEIHVGVTLPASRRSSQLLEAVRQGVLGVDDGALSGDELLLPLRLGDDCWRRQAVFGGGGGLNAVVIAVC